MNNSEFKQAAQPLTLCQRCGSGVEWVKAFYVSWAGTDCNPHTLRVCVDCRDRFLAWARGDSLKDALKQDNKL